MKQVQTTVVSSRPYLRNRTTCSNLKSPFLSSVKENRDTVWCCSKQAKALSVPLYLLLWTSYDARTVEEQHSSTSVERHMGII